MLPTPASVPRSHSPMAFEDVEDGTAGWPIPFRVTRAQPLQDLPRSPAIATVLLQDQRDHLVRCLVRTRSGRPAVVIEASHPVLPVAVSPFVAGHPADAVTRAELRHRP